MVMQLGMSDELGPIMFGTGQSEVFLGRDFSTGRNYSEEIASKIDSEIHRIVSSAYEDALRLLSEHVDKLHFIAGYLLRSETMDGEQFKRAMEEEVTYEDLDAMVADKKSRSDAENERRRKVVEENERRRREEREREERRSRESGEDTDLPPFLASLKADGQEKDGDRKDDAGDKNNEE